MATAAFTSLSGLGPLPRLLEAAGGTRLVTRVFRSENLPVGMASGDASWIPLRSLMGLFERAAAELGDDVFGLRVGQAMQPEDFGLWARYALSASTLRDMIHRAKRTLEFHQSGTQFWLEVDGEIAIWRYRVTERTAVGRRHHADHAIWPILKAFQRYAGPGSAPIRIECSYERPQRWRRLEEAYQTPLSFGKAANSIVFESRLLDEPISCNRDPRTQVTFADVRRMLRRRPPASITEAARAILEVRIAESFADIEGTALLLGLSARSLQRQLGAENLSFRTLLEQVRLQRALDLLKDTDTSITEIAFALGYDDATSFTRAFRRWAGYPPNQARRTIRQ